MAFDAAGNLYVGDGNRSRVLIYRNPFNDPTPTRTTTPGTATLTRTPNPAYTVVTRSVSPLAPHCVLRNSALQSDRLLELRGKGFSTTRHNLQSRKASTGELSIQFHMEVDWESTTHISVDMARIEHLLWSDRKLLLTVRLTRDSDWQPVSDWSPEFILADDVAACGIARPTAQHLFLPVITR